MESDSQEYESLTQNSFSFTLSPSEYQLLTTLLTNPEILADYYYKAMNRIVLEMNDEVAKAYSTNNFNKFSQIYVDCPEGLEYRPVTLLDDGDLYLGQWNKITNEKEGYGILIAQTQKVYYGSFQRDALTGDWVILYKNGSTYKGGTLANLRHGQGTYSKHNGYKYSGQWINNIASGLGVEEFANGDKYKGEFRGDKKEGQGKIWYADGQSYEGGWKDNRYWEYGHIWLNGGDEIFGNFENNEPHGQWVQIRADGRKFEGKWDEGCIKSGIYTDTKGREYAYPDHFGEFSDLDEFYK